MNFVIPMAGAGSRFAEAGYTIPKPLLLAHGRTLLQWSVDSLPMDLAHRVIFIGLEDHRKRFDLENGIRRIYGNLPIKFLWIKDTTRGQAETVWLARDLMDPEEDLLIFNIDTAFRSPQLRDALIKNKGSGILGSFQSSEPRFSFASVDATGMVTEVREKSVISKNALTGLYHFRKTSDFLHVAQHALEKNEREKGEFYVAPLYNKLIGLGHRFSLDVCEDHWILGTPEEYMQFAQNPIPG